jgi:hypothetical protein
MAERGAYSLEDFVKFFCARGIKANVAVAAWKAFSEVAMVKDFKPHPEDSLISMYGLAEEDLGEDVVLALLLQLEARVPSPSETAGQRALATVGDVVEFVDRYTNENRGREEF